MPDSHLRPDELADYKTEVQTDEVEAEPRRPTPGADQHPWILIGMFLLGVFVVVTVIAIGAALA